MPQSSKHIEQLAPELERIVSSSESIRDLADGFGGEQGPAEGPLWWKEGRYLLFSDIHNNRRMKYEPGKRRPRWRLTPETAAWNLLIAFSSKKQRKGLADACSCWRN